MNQTSRIIGPLLTLLFPDASPETVTFYHGVIRKLAHFTEYAVLGFLASRAFISLPVRSGRILVPVIATLLVLIVAGVDEAGQSLNPHRTGSIIDVLIDMAGGCAAVLLFFLTHVRRVKPTETSAAK
jgi:VanZ family protein